MKTGYKKLFYPLFVLGIFFFLDGCKKDDNSGPSGNSDTIFFDDFSEAPNGWEGETSAIETSGCNYLGAYNSGIHMAYEPAGPIYRYVPGFKPGTDYNISFTVKTLDDRDAGEVLFLIDDEEEWPTEIEINNNGKMSINFTATKSTHRFEFDWDYQSIMWSPIHISDFCIKLKNGNTVTGAPTFPESNFSEVSGTSVKFTYTVTSDEDKPVTEHGVCWSSSHEPTIYDTKTSNGSGSGTYTVTVNGLSPANTYYMRAYATNSSGTSYGEEKEISTPANQFSYTNMPGTDYVIKTTDGYEFSGILHASNLIDSETEVNVSEISYKYILGAFFGEPTHKGILMWKGNAGKNKIFDIKIRSKIFNTNHTFSGYYYDYSPMTSSTDGEWGWDVTGSPAWDKFFNDGNGNFISADVVKSLYKAGFYLDEMKILKLNLKDKN